ncbi:MAG: sodium:solute symporter family protein [Verrucomicrobiales bacterium]|nr:sodium:solute symporter family protein [Verrucomicrobiales bacterium]
MNGGAGVSLLPLYVIAGYLALLIGLGLVSNRFFRGNSADYFVVSRSIGPFLLLMSIFGTTMTGFAMVGSTGKAYTSGIGVYGLMASWSGLIHSAVFFVLGIRLWAAGKRHGFLTQCEYFRARFDSPALGYLLFPVLVLLVIPYLLVGVISAGKFLQATTAGMFPEAFALTLPTGRPHPLSGGLPPWLGALIICLIVLSYVFFGGLRGAVWANTFQTIVFMLAGGIAFWLISTRLGGLREAGRLVTESDFGSPRLARAGLMGHAQFFSYFLVPLSVGMFPHLFQHWLTARSARSFRLTVIAHPLFIAIVWVPCILIGLWATAHIGPNASPNAILGRMVNSLVHSPLLTGIVGAGVLAAIMSSLDSQFMCLGTMFTNDVVVRSMGPARFDDRQKILLARGFILLVVAVTYGLAVYLKDSAHVFDLGVWCFSGFASLFPLAFAAVYWRRTTRAGAIASVVAAAVVWFVLFRRDILARPENAGDDELLIFGMMPVAFIFAASAVTLVAVSLLTRPPAESTLARFFPRREPREV